MTRMIKERKMWLEKKQDFYTYFKLYAQKKILIHNKVSLTITYKLTKYLIFCLFIKKLKVEMNKYKNHKVNETDKKLNKYFRRTK